MASPLTEAHITAQAHLRAIVTAAIQSLWNQLPGHDERDVGPFVAAAVPVVLAGQRQSVALTEAFLARMLRRPPLGISPANLIGAGVRAGAAPEEVYRRPFVTYWTSLKNEVPWDDALNAGRARATATAAMDVQLSSRATFDAVQQVDDGIYGYRRVADSGACPFCLAVNGAYVKRADASPLHNHCGCGLEPLTSPHPRASFLPSGETVYKTDAYAIHQHGELGSYIGSPVDHFTTEKEIAT